MCCTNGYSYSLCLKGIFGEYLNVYDSHSFQNSWSENLRFVRIFLRDWIIVIAGWAHLSHWPQLLWGNTCPYEYARRCQCKVELLNSGGWLSYCLTLLKWAIAILTWLFINFSSSLINSWVVVGKNARIKTETAASDLSFDQQCRHCEKVVMFLLLYLNLNLIQFDCWIKILNNMDYPQIGLDGIRRSTSPRWECMWVGHPIGI